MPEDLTSGGDEIHRAAGKVRLLAVAALGAT